MKNLSLILLVLTLCQFTVLSQSCLPDGITFSTQAEIDDFQTNYPGCTEIEGDVIINGSNITNLNGLSVVTSIGGPSACWPLRGYWAQAHLRPRLPLRRDRLR